MTEPLLSVQNLAIEYQRPGWRKPALRVIHDVGFEIEAGHTLALVGESGSGKSSIGRAVLGLTPAASGKIQFQGQDLLALKKKERRKLSGDLQVIFQNPYGSLNPGLTIGQILVEPLEASGKFTRVQAQRRVAELLDRVHMPKDTISRYPGNFSGGQRQRIAIARALALEPKLVVCDEPTSALDVSTQAAVLELLRELQDGLNVSYLFITHDLAVVRTFADRVIVLEQGRIVEEGLSAAVCDSPQNPYTKKLVAAAPVPDPSLQRIRRNARLAMKHA
ncbi:ATP-binding cassette domain-containing protein [Glutamicibacter sp. NPDC087344]|uniref:ATP-binding cassette domain-containing protein n=1 Tax=Glutamicibacter sp. NPDC087344 TaxID=3363994 RepID=UPI0038064F31